MPVEPERGPFIYLTARGAAIAHALLRQQRRAEMAWGARWLLLPVVGFALVAWAAVALT